MPMKIGILLLLNLGMFTIMNAQNFSPEKIAQGQLDAYNKQDIEAFLSWYADDVEIYSFPNELIYQGIEEMRRRYTESWENNPNQKAKVTNRLVLQNTVMDQEHVTGRSSGIEVHVIAIYKIENNKIKKVYFVED